MGKASSYEYIRRYDLQKGLNPYQQVTYLHF